MSPPTTSMVRAGERRELVRYLAVLVGREPGAWLELRARRAAGGMTQRFYSTRALGTAADELLGLARRTDVYVGCLPRRRRAGGHDALAHGWVLWADCDDPAAVAALDAFRPRPAIVVRSGSAGNAHAYWPLLRGTAPATIAAANRRLAHALGADPRCSEPARILRPPATRSYKHDPPTAVTLERFKPARRYRLEQILAALPDPPVAPAARTVAPARGRGGDALLGIAPPVYVRELTGLRVGRDGKVRCPFHGQDRTPSLHVYPEPERGWTCFGCGRGGSIFDLAAELDGIPPRGAGFVALRERLEQRFEITRSAR